jgi:RHS repeat-associated protein
MLIRNLIVSCLCFLSKLIVGVTLLFSVGANLTSAQEGEGSVALSYLHGQGSVGGSGALGPTGAYTTSVPLSLPPPRGDFPVPLSVIYTGGNRVGAAGVGWSIPISYVRQSTTLSRRKPVHKIALQTDDETLPKTAPRLFLDMGSGPMLMSKSNVEGVFRPFAAGQHIELTETSDGWIAVDPAGRKFTFSQVLDPNPDLSIPSISTELGDKNLWLLTRITDRTGKNWVSLRYDVFDTITPPPPPSTAHTNFKVKEVVLRELSYSYDSSGTCPKHRIELGYRYLTSGNILGFPQYLDVQVSDGHMRARTNLLDTIKVWSQGKTSCLESDVDLLMTYKFKYAKHLDTGRLRLAMVDLFGRGEISSDEPISLPLSRYEYGTATSGESLVYGSPKAVVLDLGFTGQTGVSVTHNLPSGSTVNSKYLRDVTGDNRADYVRFSMDGEEFEISANVPDLGGKGFSTFPSSIAYPAPDNWNEKALPTNVGSSYFSLKFSPLMQAHNTWQQPIDWNGDGRVDIVQALFGRDPDGNISPNYWRVFINTAGSSGDPSDIEWQETHVDISYLRAQISQIHPEFSKKGHLPVAKSRATRVVNSADGNVERNGRITEWKLFDVNGDSFPDFVFNSNSLTSFPSMRNDDTGIILRVNSDGVLVDPDGFLNSPGTHHPVNVIDLPLSNSLMVVYHTGLLMGGAGNSSISRWNGPALVLRQDGYRGVEQFQWGGNHTQHMTSGFLEVNGDGLTDYILERGRNFIGEEQFRRLAIRSSGLPQQIDQQLTENLPIWPFIEEGRAIIVPGPINVVQDPKIIKCGQDGTEPGGTFYFTRQLSTLRDLTGDGIADYVYFGKLKTLSNGDMLDYTGVKSVDDTATEEQWWIMIGTGVGFVPPRSIETSTNAPFEIYKTRERCDGQYSITIADLIDMDGDGRVDTVSAHGPGQVLVSRLQGGTSGASAHDAGRLIREDNGYGAATLITYGSAKTDSRTVHQVPFAEIVPVKIQTITKKGLGASLEPLRYAYGDAHLHYQPLMGAWSFRGYGKRVVLQGLPSTNGVNARIKGTATITQNLKSEDLSGSSSHERHALIGTVRDISSLVGDFTNDPRDLLGFVFGTDPRWQGNNHVKHAVKPMAGSNLSLALSLSEECYDLKPFGPPLGIGDLNLCRRMGISFQKEISSWVGTSPFPAQDSVATRTVVSEVDDFGRPIKIKFENDRSQSDDDICTQITYASGSSESTKVMDAVHIQRFNNCKTSHLVYSGSRFLYDNLPEGQFDKGLVTGQIVERYDVLSGEKLEEFQLNKQEYDNFGNTINQTTLREDGVTSSTDITFDAFGLVPQLIVGKASDVAVSLKSQMTYDPITLLPVHGINASGLQLRISYDSIGRPRMTTIQLPGDPEEYVTSTMEYLGDKGADPQGRRAHWSIFRKWVPASLVLEGGGTNSSAVNEIVNYFDELERLRYQETDLGADYNDKKIVLNYVEYDGLGRPLFVASPFQPGEPPNASHGMTFRYLPNGLLECMIQGEGLQTSATTDESVNRYSTCVNYSFKNHTAIAWAKGPNELLAGNPQFGAYDESVSTAIGRTLSQSRLQSGERLEHSTFEYDRLGQVSKVLRYASPDLLDGLVTWKTRRDSLGQIISIEEPAEAIRSYHYDHWGNLARVTWTDTGVTPVVQRSIISVYDGFGRMVSKDETEDGVAKVDRHVDYTYDISSGDANHLGAENLIGRLSHTRDSVMSTFFGYDGIGHSTTVSRAHHSDGERHTTARRLGPLGTIEELTFLNPDLSKESETATYTYDSAGRMKGITWTDATGTDDLWTAAEIDIFGRYRQINLGNGITQRFDYQPNGRRELFTTRIHSGSAHRENHFHYDGQMNLKRREVIDTFGSSVLEETNTYSYDLLNRLARAKTSTSIGGDRDEEFRFDGLGNIVEIIDHKGSNDLVFIPDLIDLDRICKTFVPSPDAVIPDLKVLVSPIENAEVFSGTDAGTSPSGDTGTSPSGENKLNVIQKYTANDAVHSTICNYRYDAMGNVKQIIDGPQSERNFEYDAGSRIVSMSDNDALAKTQYDSLGAIGERVVTGVGVGRNRINRHYGSLIEKSIFLGDDNLPTTINDEEVSFQSYLERRIFGPAGPVARVRRTDAGEKITLYPHGDFTANRFITEKEGETSQRIEYRPFGEIITNTGNSPRTNLKYLWNAGENFEEFGVTHLGARLYEPNTGRFLQRDPLLIPRTSSIMHPYAFAGSDPVNFADPLGLDRGSPEFEAALKEALSWEKADAANVDRIAKEKALADTVNRLWPGDKKWYYTGFSGVRIARPGEHHRARPEGYTNVKSRMHAADGDTEMAEIAEQRCGAMYCHVIKSFGHVPSNDELDLAFIDDNVNTWADLSMTALSLPISITNLGPRSVLFGGRTLSAGSVAARQGIIARFLANRIAKKSAKALARATGGSFRKLNRTTFAVIDGHTLHIVAHGTTNGIAHTSATHLANLIRQNGIAANEIILHSCRVGCSKYGQKLAMMTGSEVSNTKYYVDILGGSTKGTSELFRLNSAGQWSPVSSRGWADAGSFPQF